MQLFLMKFVIYLLFDLNSQYVYKSENNGDGVVVNLTTRTNSSKEILPSLFKSKVLNNTSANCVGVSLFILSASLLP
jgi:hypothetical protein